MASLKWKVKVRKDGLTRNGSWTDRNEVPSIRSLSISGFHRLVFISQNFPSNQWVGVIIGSYTIPSLLNFSYSTHSNTCHIFIQRQYSPCCVWCSSSACFHRSLAKIFHALEFLMSSWLFSPNRHTALQIQYPHILCIQTRANINSCSWHVCFVINSYMWGK